MSGAINVEYGVDRARKLDRIAAKMSMRRNDLLRRMADEVIAADEEGREAFTVRAEADETDPADLRYLIQETKNNNVEIERSRKRQDARERAQVDRDKAQAERVEALMKRLDALEAERDAAVEAAAQRTEEHLIKAVGRAVLPSLDRVREDMEEVKAEARKPRTAKYYNIGLGQWTGRALAVAFMILMLVAAGAFFGLAWAVPERKIAVPSGMALLGGGDVAICKAVDYRYATERCRVVFGGRTVTVTAQRPSTGLKASR